MRYMIHYSNRTTCVKQVVDVVSVRSEMRVRLELMVQMDATVSMGCRVSMDCQESMRLIKRKRVIVPNVHEHSLDRWGHAGRKVWMWFSFGGII